MYHLLFNKENGNKGSEAKRAILPRESNMAINRSLGSNDKGSREISFPSVPELRAGLGVYILVNLKNFMGINIAWIFRRECLHQNIYCLALIIN